MKRTEIEQLLPGIFRRTICRGNPLYALLEVMEALHAPSEAVLERLEMYLDPYRTPDHFVPYLACWLDLGRLLADADRGLQESTTPSFASGLGRLRELIAAAAYLSKWRGTRKGLQRFLETATGLAGFAIDEQVPDEDGRPKPFHILVRAPAAAEQYRGLVERVIEMEKPAYVTYALEFV